jgi:hypothetical protein
VDSPTKAQASPTAPFPAFGGEGEDDESSGDSGEASDIETGDVAGKDRPHDTASATCTELRRELRFALQHQRNVAVNRLNEMWDSGIERVRALRDDQEARFRQDELNAASGPSEREGGAYARAIELLKNFSGDVTLDKYRQMVETRPSAAAPKLSAENK